MEKYGVFVDVLGISCDSFNTKTLTKIGRKPRGKTTLETSGEDVKTTLETSGEDVKTTLGTSGELQFAENECESCCRPRWAGSIRS